ncbi:corticoliberin-like [Lethenteron reissneri]|uniref:corticoliberin-like n=1 Tax=Lethenteron reissneri TaxID=7753 RepID=UPI002AB6394E|nr:corticoliberin-like [Lethenteron reissneri]
MKLGTLLLFAVAVMLPPRSAISVAQPRSLRTLIKQQQDQQQQQREHRQQEQQQGLTSPWPRVSLLQRAVQRPPPLLEAHGSAVPWDRFSASARLLPSLWRVGDAGGGYAEDGGDYGGQGKETEDGGGEEVGEAEEEEERRLLLEKRGEVPTSLDLTFHLMRELLDAARAEKMVIQAHSNRKIMDSAGK